MGIVDGIHFEKFSDYAICCINGLSEGIKELIREQLSFICYGHANSASSYSTYNYVNTLKEFLKRYLGKSAELQKGMIGELLAHLVVNELFPEYRVVSPYFNKEERNIKKGFDIILSSRTGDSIWITEVKSGELHRNKDANGTAKALITLAKQDLGKRLNQESTSLWLNAINDAQLAIEESSDFKGAVLNILHDYVTRSDSSDCQLGPEINAFLVSTLFASLSDSVTTFTVRQSGRQIKKEALFRKHFIMVIQKGTYKKVSEFLEQESE